MFADVRLEATRLSTLTRATVDLAHCVAEFAGAPGGTAVDAAAVNEAGPDAAPKRDDGEVTDLSTWSDETLRNGKGIDVVVDGDRNARPVLQQFRDRHIDPAEERRESTDAGAPVDRTGHAQADAAQPIMLDPDRDEQVVHGCRGKLHHIGSSVRSKRNACVGHDRALDVDEDRQDLVVHQLQARDNAHGRVEIEEHRPPTTRRVSDRALDQETFVDEVADDPGDRPAAQAGQLREIRPAGWTLLAE